MNFKKQISVFLAVLLLVSNVGLAFNVHYCGGEIASVSLNSTLPSLQSEKGCCETKASKKDSCCKDKKIVVQKKTDNGVVKSFSFQFNYAFVVPEYNPIVFTTVPSFKNNSNLSYYCDANSPPLFKLYSQYLLYDRL
ncbi:hypothetical protein FNW52_01790 [Flavobacterium sp. ZT3R18]|uniref:HYC_CC_PP family protein n=1 Tax=Flavobacterium sp. ZT3R18 TaxID=2594429 RepID=UPI00117B3D7F|nr:hypothetical protein [Flavobacterium sp. ZT3R18]TRX38802.1 hypothetical protein FNW52_01790 [Flavobacterium sp. ZT3R18]